MFSDLVTQFYANAGLYDYLFGPPPVQVTEMGPLRIERTVQLEVNQIPKSVTFLVTAAPNRALVSAQQVAEVRLEGDGSGSAFIVDFQTLRTVSAIGVPFPGGDDPLVIPWIGTRYDDDNPLALTHVPATGFSATLGDGTTGRTYTFPEVQTERLRVVLSGSVSQHAVDTFAAVKLPTPPADLEITVDGKVAWNHQNAIRPDPADAPPQIGVWNRSYRTIVDLTAAVRAALEESGASSATVVLTTRSPGELHLDPAELEVTHQVSVRFPEGDARTISFAEEGRQELLLPVAKDATGWTIQQIGMIVEAPSGSDRVLPSIGPAFAASTGSESWAAELVLDRERAVVVALPRSELASLDQLTAVRVFLVPSGEGVELAGLLYEQSDHDRPGDAIADVTLGPVRVGGTEPRWVTLPLGAPYKIAGRALWLGVQALRGRASWPLGVRTESMPPIFRGLPEGPFRELPAAPPELQIAGFGPVVRVSGTPPSNVTLPVGKVIAKEPDIGSEIPVERDGAKIVLLANGAPLEVRSPPSDQFAYVALAVESARAGDFRVREVRISYDV